MELKTKCGGTMIIPSKTFNHFLVHTGIGDILTEVISKVELPKDCGYLAMEVDMGRIIGRSGCVKTPPIGIDDPAFFARRVNRDNDSRVAIVEQGDETDKVSVLAFAARGEKNVYILARTFIGPLAPKEPWDRNINCVAEFDSSYNFWSTHALVYEPGVMGDYFESTWREVTGKGNFLWW